MKYKKSYSVILVLGCLMLTGCHIKHDWLEATCTEPRTCITGGETEGEPLGHTWEEATCTTAKVCSVCEETEGEPLGHIWEEATCTTAKVCSVCGETEGEPLGHRWETISCLEPQVCSVCRAEGEVSGHNWNVEYATCDTDKSCMRCNTVEMYALGHELVESGVCKRCNKQIGVLLSAYNFGGYFSVTPKTTSNSYTDNVRSLKKYFYQYSLEVSKTIGPTYKFHNVKIKLKMYLTSDFSLGEDGALSGTMHDVILTIDEDGKIISRSPSQSPVTTKFEIEGLNYFGYVYEVEGFCYDTMTATLAE